MKKVHITLKNKSFNSQKLLSEVSLVRAASLGVVMAALLSSVSPVFASHLSSTGATVQSVSAGVVSANVGHGRVGVANGSRFCGVDQVVSRTPSRWGKKVSAEKSKKLTANQLSDGSSGYFFESSCEADASVNALASASTHASIDGVAGDWFLEENNPINWSVNTRSVNTTGARVADGKDTDAVNVAQLKALPAQDGIRGDPDLIYLNSQGQIAIGGKTRGEVINISNEDGHGRFILGVKGGSIKPASTDAINGSQLYGTNTTITKYLGGGAAYDGSVGDKWTEPTYEIQSKGYHDVGSAFAGVDSKLSELSKKVEGVEGSTNLVVQDPGKHTITIGAKAEGGEISIANSSRRQRKLTGLAKGELSEDSQEAITGGQLYETNSTIAKYLGGKAAYEGGKWTEPTYEIQSKDHHDVGSAFAGVDSKLSELSKKVEGVEGSTNLVVQDPEKHTITIGAKAEGGEISIANSSREQRKLTGLADGELSEDSKEAITGGQLYETNSTIAKYLGGKAAYEGGKWTEPTFMIQSKGHHDVGSAFAGVDSKLSELSKQVGGVEGSLIVHQEKETHKITIGAKVEGKEISIANKSKGLRKLTGLEEGAVSEVSTDAVSGKQLHGVKQSVEKLSSTVDKAKEDISTLDKNLNASLGGGANVFSGTAPKYKIQGQSRTGVEAAFQGVDETLTQLSGKISEVEKNSFVAQEDSGLITIGAKVEGKEISIANKSKGLRKLTGLAEGAVSAGSTDAVSGKQLYKVEQKFDPLNAIVEKAGKDILTLDKNIKDSLGGGADVLKGTAPKYEIQGQGRTGVEAAFQGVDETLTVLSKQVEGVTTAVSNGLVTQDKSSNIITIGKDVEGGEISIANKNKGLRKLTGLEEGDVSKTSTDAVTGKQLHEVKQNAEGLSSTVNKAKEDISTLDKNLNASLGGGANVFSGTAPIYTIQNKKRTGVEAAFQGVDEILTQLSGKIGEVEKNSLVAQESSGLITIGGKVEGKEISIADKSKGLRKLTGLEEGAVSAGSTDAVSGKQLHGVKQSVEKLSGTVGKAEKDILALDKNLNASLGGGADVLKGTAPKYEIQGQGRTGVEAAFKGVDETLTGLSKKVEGVEGSLIVHQEKETHKITIGAKVEGKEISIANKSKGLRKLTGLEEGAVSEVSTDAVSGKQLHGVKQSVEKLSSTVDKAKEDISTLDKNLNASLGGGANVFSGTAPKYKIQGQSRTGVEAAFQGVDETLTQLSGKISEVEKNSFVAQEDSGLITIGAKVEGKEISIANKSKGLRKLTGLAEGAVSAGSTDAVSGKQLYKVEQKFDPLNAIVEKAGKDILTLDKNIKDSLGGGADVLKGTAPKYEIQGQGRTGVEAAFQGVDETLTVLSKQVEGVTTAVSNGLVTQDKSSNIITIGKDVEGGEISIANKNKGLRKLTGLEEGDVSKTSTDAVTGKQLHEVKQNAEGLSSTVNKAKEDISTLDKNLNASLGGGANVFSGTAPIYTIQNKKRTGVEAAFQGVDETLTQLSGKIGEVEKNSLVAQESSGLITIGGKVEGKEISIADKSKGLRKLTGLEEGAVSAGSTDAVSGKQLHGVKQSVEKLSGTVGKAEKDILALDKNLNASLGGGADVLKGTAPKYEIQGQGRTGVEAAFKGVDETLTGLSKKVEGVEGSLIVHQEKETHKITIGAKVEGKEISIANKSKGLRKLTGLEEGAVSEVSTDAVSGKQLHKVEQKFDPLNVIVKKAEKDILTLDKNIKDSLGGGADVLKGTAPKYEIQGQGRTGVEAAFQGVDETLTVLSKQVEGVTTAVSNSLVTQDKSSNVITIGKDVEGGEISIANKSKGLRKLTGLAEGDVSIASTEAITGSQLHKVEQKFDPLNVIVEKAEKDISTLGANINKYLGGGANIFSGTELTYTIQDNPYHSIASAFEGVDNTLTDLYEKFDSLQNSVGDDSLVAQHSGTKLITIGGNVEGSKINITNSKGKARTLTGLADGQVSAGSTDAVTGSQLHKVEQKFNPLNAIVEKAGEDISTLGANINEFLGGGADVLKGTAPIYTIQDQDHIGIEAAFKGVDNTLTDLYEKFDKVESIGDDSLIAQHSDTKVITIGGKVEGSKINITNSKGKARKLTGLADGDVSEVSTDAVSGKQLHKVEQKFDPLNAIVEKAGKDILTLDASINKYLGGGASVLEDIAPTYKIQSKEYDNVASAFVGVDNTLTALSKQVEGVTTAVSNSLIAQDESSNVITIGAKTGGDEISIANNSKGFRKLTGLAEGDVSAGSTEAITGSQLHKVEQKFDPLNVIVEKAEKDISTLEANINKYLGGGVNIFSGTELTYTIQDNPYHSIASAFEGVDNTLTDLYEKFDSLQNSVGDDSLVAQHSGTKLITIGGNVEGSKINITNSKGKARTLTGLADGQVSAGSTDAVTGSQLHKVGQKFDPLNAIVEKAGEDISTLGANINEFLGGGADVLKGTAPIYTIQDQDHIGIEAAFKGVDNTLTDLYEKFDKVESIGDDSLIAQHSDTKVITIGGKVEGSKINITNSKGKARKLTGLADGDVSEVSTDAVSGKQLHKVEQKFDPLNAIVEKAGKDILTLDASINKYLGGGASVLEDIAPTYKIQSKEYDNVASAFVGVDNTLTALSKQVEGVTTAVSNSLIAQDESSNVITIGAKTGGDEISIANNSKGFRKLTGLAEGDVSAGSTEAITGNQLYEVNKQLATYFGGGAGYQDGKWTDPTFTITDFDAQNKNGKQAYHNVAEAFDAVNNSMSGLNDRIKHVETQTSSSVNSSISWDNEKNAYDASHNGQVGKITNVANGAIEKGSTDVVTGDQLWATNEKIDSLENKVDDMVNNIDILTDGFVTYDKDKQGNKTNSITLVGADDDTPVTIDNVADGKVEKGSKQAVNGGQLHDYVQEQMALVLADANKYTDKKIENIVGDAVAQANAYTDMKFEALNYKIENVQKEARQAAAIGLAVANLRYNDIPGKLSVAFGNGIWRNHSGAAFGAGYTSEDGNTHSNLSFTTSGGHWGVGAGISFTLN
ncbi:YadA-like family protein [Bartonella sp. WD16.2]|uniref:YadA-like family protein n=1 Tax=Bartonella sp. WD16.2 TaxID=1933904 RepID=UPI0009C2B2F5|nr:YadA-like family protein [Bartonella sp. WD16.2]AQX19290.1 YadA-like C-terminal region [Bartonella sp. WD16.2]